MLRTIGQRTFRGTVGDPLAQEFAVHCTDAAGATVANQAIVFECDPPGAVLFEGQPYAIVQTEDGVFRGRAKARGTIQRPGKHIVRAQTHPSDADHTVTFDVEHTDGPQVHNVGGRAIVTHPWGGPTPQPPRQRIGKYGATALISLIVVAGVLAAIAMLRGAGSSRHSGSNVVATQDDAARQAAAAARLEAETAKAAAEAATRQAAAAATKHDLESALIANSAADQIYAATGVEATTRNQVFDQEAFARVIRQGRNREAQRLVCTTNPRLPSCRRPARRYASAPTP